MIEESLAKTLGYVVGANLREYMVKRGVGDPLTALERALNLISNVKLGGFEWKIEVKKLGDRVVSESGCPIYRAGHGDWCEKCCETFTNAWAEAIGLNVSVIEKAPQSGKCRFEFTKK